MEEGDPWPHCREEEDVDQGGREEARGGGRGACHLQPPPSSAQGARTVTNSAARWISFVLEERGKNVPVCVEMICSSAQVKLTK